MKRTILLSMLTISIVASNAKTPFIDGVIYPDEYDSKIATGDGKSCPFNIANCKEMYFAQDADFYYLAVSFKATTSMNWAFIISLNDKDGGAYDPRPRMVTYEHPRKPSLMISGSFSSAVPHSYSAYIHGGTYWTGPISFLGSLMASNVMVADHDDCLEISIPKSYLGSVTQFDAQFYLSGAILTRNTVFDAIPDDNIPTSVTSTTILHNYAHAFTTLPITLTSFTATPTNSKSINLEWQYVKPYNFNHFEIVRNNKVIGATTGTSFKDVEPLDENFYKLKMVDNDGTFTYSKTVSVKLINDNAKVLQNPVSNVLKLQFIGTAKLQNISIYSSEGRKVYTTTYQHAGNTSIANFNLPTLSPGIYQVVINNKAFSIFIQQ